MTILNIKLNIIIFAGIIFIGLLLRTWNLSGIPAGFFCDEASVGYNAYKILTKGTDEHGVPFPVFFQAFGEYKSPIQTYSTVPFIAILGLNENAVRLPSAIYGILTLGAIYFLVKTLFKQSREADLIALLSMFFLAISPWAVHFSRVSLEGLMAFVFYTTSGLYLLLKAQENSKLMTLSFISFALALYSYFPARIFIPLFGLGLFIIYRHFFIKHYKATIINGILLLLLLVPIIQSFFTSAGLARWNTVNIFSHPPEKQTVYQHIASNYLNHFSTDFLFIKGDKDMPGQFISRHSTGNMGELYFFQFPLIVIGFLALLKRKRKALYVLSLWLILYPAGSMFTTDNNPQATRSIIGVIPFQIISAVGVIYFLDFLHNLKTFWKTFIIWSSSVVIIFSFGSYLNLYFKEYKNYSSDFWGWQYGAREIVHYFNTHQKEYDDLVMAPEFNSPDIFFKFYSSNNCLKCKTGLPDNYLNPKNYQIFAITPAYTFDHPQYNYKIIKKIYYPNGNEAFRLTEITN